MKPRITCRKRSLAFVPTVVLSLVSGLGVPLRAAAAQEAADFYVAPTGDDGWSGALPVPNAQRTEGPFATLQRARDAVRQLRARQCLVRPVTVKIRAGTYRLSHPFVLRPEDSGSPASPTIYEAYPGERPVLSGGVPVSGWEPAEGPLWKVALVEQKAAGRRFRQMFIDGRRRNRAHAGGR